MPLRPASPFAASSWFSAAGSAVPFSIITPAQATSIVTQVTRLYANARAKSDKLQTMRSEMLPALPHHGAFAVG